MKYCFVEQHDSTDCAAACMAMICSYYKKEVTITSLRDLMGTDIKGTNLIGITKCAEKLGFTTQAVRVDYKGFKSGYTLPAIANVVTKEGMSHFVVVFKVTEKYVIIGDPAKDIIKDKIEDFYASFTGKLVLLAPNNEFVATKTSNSLVGRYLHIFLAQKKLFASAVFASFCATVLGIVSSSLNSIIFDEVLPYSLTTVLNSVLVLFLMISITSILLDFFRQWILLHLSIKIDIPLMMGYFKHIYKLPMAFFSSRKTGDIITRFSDAFTIKDIFTSIALSLVIDISMAILSGIVLAKINIKLFVIILLMTLISIILVYIFKQPYKKINERQMQQASILNSEIIEGIRAIETIKGNAVEDIELENIEREFIKSLKISYKEGMLSNIQNMISEIISGVGNLVLLYYGISQVMTNEISLGVYMAFMALSQYFLNPVGSLVGLQLEIQEAQISMKRLSEILDIEIEQNDKKNMPQYKNISNITGDIEINNVTFRYGNRTPALNGVSVSIHAGEKVAIVGESGSGKTTLAKLLLKYYEPEDGFITINGINIVELNNQSLRENISYVPQNIELFSKSIFENIRVCNPQATMDEVVRACKKAMADDFIRKLPLQYGTFLEEGGNGLSGGERQRLAIARAFLKNNNFYIFDESTSNLDFQTENLIFETIFNTLQDQTVLIIAHRLSTIKKCDQIIVMDQGELIEKGTHEELLKKGGKYKSLWDYQEGHMHKEKSTIINENNLEFKEEKATIISEDNLEFEEGDIISYS